jgi:4-oxalocrotonate tautomerase
MPMISFESGQLTDEIKEKLIMQLTDISVEITGIPKELFFVSIRELDDKNIAVGGKTVKELKNELEKNKI